MDPFVGAGTTMAAARRRGINAIGADLSPLSVLVSNAKVSTANYRVLRAGLKSVLKLAERAGAVGDRRSPRLQRAFTDPEFKTLKKIQLAVLSRPSDQRDFLLLALLQTARRFSRAIPDGGWFRWRDLPSSEESILPCFRNLVEEMLADVARIPETTGLWKAYLHDARALRELVGQAPILATGCDAIICSPPYPNRHDYTRIHQIELLMLGATEQEISRLRRVSLRSHVEARRPSDILGLQPLPHALSEILGRLPKKGLDSRVRPMLAGYFEDLGLVLTACQSILKPGGHLALVVGNVRHGGVMVPVDEILVEMSEKAGLPLVVTWVARLRGNSAQQMGRYGRQPSRESVVICRRR